MPDTSQISKSTSIAKAPGKSANLQNAAGKPASQNQSQQQSLNKPQEAGGQNNSGGPEEIAKQAPGGAGGSAEQIAKETEKRAVSFAMDMDIIVMLPIAVVLDATCILAFFLVFFFGIGIGLQESVGVTGDIVIGLWIIIRTCFRGITQKIISSIEGMVKSAGENKNGQQTKPTPAPSGQKVGKKAGKKSIQVGMSIVVWLVSSIIKLIPVLGDLIPSFTITVLWTILKEHVNE